jgi:hypothetical protein
MMGNDPALRQGETCTLNPLPMGTGGDHLVTMVVRARHARSLERVPRSSDLCP